MITRVRMEPRPQPTPPKPEDFQISDADITRVEDLERRTEILVPKLSFGAAGVAVAALGLAQMDWKSVFSAGPLSVSTYGSLLLLAIAWFFFTMLGTFLSFLIFYPVARCILNRTPHADAVRRYKAAVVEFREWLDRSRRSWWLRLDGRRFELELARLFRALEWEAKPTRATGDGGIDIVGKRAAVKFIAQCKNHKLPIGPAAARDLYGTLVASDANFAILASVSGFTKGVHEFVKGKPVELIDLDWIIREHMQLDASWKSLTHPSSKRPSKFMIGLRRSV